MGNKTTMTPTISELERKANVQLDKLPKVIIAKLLKEEMKADTRGKECLFWELELPQNKITPDGGTFTQKISRGFYRALNVALTSINITDTSVLVGKTLELTKFEEKIMPDSFPRWFPSKIID